MNTNNNKGFSLIEVLVSLMIVMILTIGIYSLIILALNVSHDNKAYIEAIAIANQRMERIRNLPYDSVGTASGNPSGSISDYESIIRGAAFLVHTVVEYYDDPYDGTLASTTDGVAYGFSSHDDYKIATVDVSWESKFGYKHVTLFSKIIPRTIETDTGNGLIKIIVVDANGDPVSGANIHIENNIIASPISVDLLSDANGERYYSAEPSTEGYEVTVTKAGYGIDQTYERDGIVRGIVNANPTKPHLSVQAGLLTEESFQIDLLGYLDIWTIYQALPANWEIINDTSGEPQVNARLAFDSLGNTYVAWEDYADASKSKIHVHKYQSDGTPIWPSDVIAAPSSDTILPDIQLDLAGNLYISWADDSVGQKEVYLVSLLSANGNDRWGGEKKINTTWNSNQFSPRIALLEKEGAGAATTSIVWADNEWTEYDIFMDLYKYDGTAVNLEKKINDTANPDGSNQYDPTIASNADDELYIAWTDDRNDDLDIYAAKLDSSQNFAWSPTNKNVLVSTSSDQYEPDIAIDTLGNVYIVWTDERNGDKDIYGQKFDSNGVPQWGLPTDVRMDDDATGADQSEPAIAIDTANNIYIVWTDERNGDKDIYGQKYNTSGLPVWATDMRINMGTDTSQEYNPDVTIDTSVNPDVPYATWQSDKNGDFDVMVSSFNFSGSSSSVPNIGVLVTGSKKVGDNPIIYEYVDDYYTAPITGYLNLQVEWDSPGYTIDVITASSGGRNLMLAEPTQPVEVWPASTSKAYLYLDTP